MFRCSTKNCCSTKITARNYNSTYSFIEYNSTTFKPPFHKYKVANHNQPKSINQRLQTFRVFKVARAVYFPYFDFKMTMNLTFGSRAEMCQMAHKLSENRMLLGIVAVQVGFEGECCKQGFFFGCFKKWATVYFLNLV